MVHQTRGRRIIFFGDSITEMGASEEGYVALVREHLAAREPSAEIIGAGVGGNKVTDLRLRLERDVLKKDPDIVVIYIGINDVWHTALPDHAGTSVVVFRVILEEIVSHLKAAGCRVILCTPSVIGERWDGSNPLDGSLEEYAGVIRKVALEMEVGLCDLRTIFIEYLRVHNTENSESGVLTTDSVHLNDAGNKLVADQLNEHL